MVGWLRWCAVAAGVAGLVALPSLAGLRPAREADVSAADLLARIKTSADAGYTGYAETVGGLRLPLTDQFEGLTDLLGDRSRLRVWWRGPDDWRIDALAATGETDVYGDATGTWTWEYEGEHAVRAAIPPVRIPRGADLDPAQLARRLLSEADPGEVSRLPARRVAGRDAPGLRLRPDDPQTTVRSVDVWADPGSGVPLHVEVVGGGTTVVSSSYLDFRPGTPDPSTTSFIMPPGESVRVEQSADLATRIDRFAPYVPPDELVGYPLRQRVDGLGAVGTYGRGVSVLVAIPLPGRVSRPLGDQLEGTPGLVDTAAGPQLTVGPLSLLLSRVAGRIWLLAGTVTTDTLQRAAAQLAAAPPRIR